MNQTHSTKVVKVGLTQFKLSALNLETDVLKEATIEAKSFQIREIAVQLAYSPLEELEYGLYGDDFDLEAIGKDLVEQALINVGGPAS